MAAARKSQRVVRYAAARSAQSSTSACHGDEDIRHQKLHGRNGRPTGTLAEIRLRVRMPVATGESEMTRFAFQVHRRATCRGLPAARRGRSRRTNRSTPRRLPQTAPPSWSGTRWSRTRLRCWLPDGRYAAMRSRLIGSVTATGGLTLAIYNRADRWLRRC